MQIIDQKLGTVGDIHASIVNGQLVIGVDGNLDLIAQLEKLRVGHEAGLVGSLIVATEDAIKALTAPAAAPSA